MRRVLLLTVVLSGCAFNYDPGAGPITCGPAPENLCPKKWHCLESTRFCVPDESGDVPSLRLVSVNPPQARDGVTVKLTVESSLSLTDAPRLTYRHSQGVLSQQRAVDAGAEFKSSDFAFAVTPEIGEGLVTLFADATATTGTGVIGVEVGSFTVDRTSPAVASRDGSEVLDVSVVPGVARPGAQVTVQVRMTEAVTNSVRLVARENGVSRLTGVAPRTNVAAVVTFQFTVPTDAQSGVWTFELTDVADLAGNVPSSTLPLGSITINSLTVDVVPPVISPLGLQGGVYSAQPGFNVVQVPVQIDDPDAVAEVCLANTCVPAMPGTTVPMMVSTMAGQGPQFVLVRAHDLAGNQAQKVETVIFDFDGPTVIGTIGSELTPPPNCPLRHVSALALGATHTVFFTVSETLSVAPEVKTGALTYQSVSSQAPNFSFTLTPTAGTTSQTADATVRLVDRVGNATTTVLQAGLVVDLDAPAPLGPAEQAKLLYQRVPWGSAATQGLPRFAVTVAAGTLAAGESLAFLETAVASSQVLGQTQARADGSAPLTEFTLVDRAQVYARRYDSACNAATPAPQVIQNVEWVATGATGPGSAANPHRMAQREQTEARDDTSDALIEPPFLDTRTSQPPVRKSTGRWELATSSPAPAALTVRTGMASAIDTRRGRIVMFGGDTVVTGALNEAWQLDDQTWSRISTPSGLSARTGASLTYDPDNDRFILMGGTSVPDCWVYDSRGWSPLPTPVNMQNLYGRAAAYDPDNHRIVFFGGFDGNTLRLNHTWALSGTEWTQITNGGAAMPSGRTDPVFVWDGARHRFLMFGGTGNGGPPTSTPEDTWQLVGDTWSLLNTPTHPTSRAAAASVYDPVRRRVVVFSGAAGSATARTDTWQFDDQGWSQLSPTVSPPGRWSARTVVDPETGRILVVGGAVPGLTTTDAWVLDGDQWADVSVSMPDRAGHLLHWDPTRRRAVLFGGRMPSAGGWLNDTWFFSNNTWSPLGAGALPSGRSSATQVYDTVRGRTVLFGGVSDAGQLAETYEFRDSRWQAVPTPPLLTARSEYGSGIDSQGRLMISNGLRAGVALRENWLLTDRTWAQAPQNPPAMGERFAPCFTYDPARDRFVAFGGQPTSTLPDGGLRYNDTWQYTEDAGWVELASSPNSIPRSRCLVATSPAGTITYYGGRTPITFSTNVFQLRGTTWSYIGIGVFSAGGYLAIGEPGFAYDEKNNRTVWFGGSNIGTAMSMNSTEYLSEAGQWSMGPVAPPLLYPRQQSSLTFDRTRGRLVMLGGRAGSTGVTPPFNDSWQLENETWQQVPTPTALAGRVNHSVSYDSLRAQLVLSGGLDLNNRPLADTWLLKNIAPRGPATWVSFDVSGVVPEGAQLLSVTPVFHGSGYGATTVSQLPPGASLLPDGGALLSDGGTASNPDGGSLMPLVSVQGGLRLETWDVGTSQRITLATGLASTHDFLGQPVTAPDGGLIADNAADVSAVIEDLPDGGGWPGLVSRLSAQGRMAFQATTLAGSSVVGGRALPAELAVDYAELKIRYRVP